MATVALFWIVPAWPFAHLDDPSHWGILGYALALVLVATRRVRSRGRVFPERQTFVAFLTAMPLVYVADGLRFGASDLWLAIEGVGVVAFGALAWLGVKRSPWFLACGIAAHALWDLWHWGNVTFVPGWYALGCAVVDPALGWYVAVRCRDVVAS